MIPKHNTTISNDIIVSARRVLTHLFLLIALVSLAVNPSLAEDSSPIEVQIMDLINQARGLQYSNTQQGIDVINEAIKLADKHELPLDQAHARAGRALLYSHLGKFDVALEGIKSALTRIESLESSPRKAQVIGFAGFIYMRAGRSEEALFYYQQAQDIYSGLPEEFVDYLERQHEYMTYMAQIYITTEQYDQVLRLLLNVEPYWEELTLIPVIGFYYIAEAYYKLGQPEKALPYAQQVLDWATSQEHGFAAAQGNYILGEVKTGLWQKNGNRELLQEAHNHFQESIEFSNAIPDKRIDHLIKMLGLAITQRHLDMPDEAKTTLQEALILSIRIKEWLEEIKIREQLIELLRDEDPNEALMHAQAITEISKNNHSQTFSTELAQLLIDYDVISKQNRLQKVFFENKELETRQFTILLVAGFGSLIVILLGGYTWRIVTFKARQKQLQEEVSDRTKELRDSESKYRDLFNVTLKEKERTEEALRQERIAIQRNLNFIDMISHEYRTPLTVIDSSLDLLKQGDESPVKSVERMKHSVKKLLYLFETSLSELRISDDFIIKKTEQLSLNLLSKLIVDYARRAYPEHTIISNYNDVDEQHIVEIDPDLINIALTNIIDNACKYSDEEHPIKVMLSDQSQESDAYAQIDIIDNGRGINPDELPKIFEKYYRASSGKTEKGTGVGLFLVKRIIEMHGGSVVVDSKLGKGSKFTVTLPLAKQLSVKEGMVD